MREFKDKVAVVTGAASGIGRALAERCVQEGMKVVLADIEGPALAQTQQELQSAGATSMAVRTDVSQAIDVQALAVKTLEAFGAVHLLFNNAGVGAGGAVWESTVADWAWVIGVNLWGVIHGLRVFVPIMMAQDAEGHIVNTASSVGLSPYDPSAPYHMTKHGVIALSENLYYSLKQRGARLKVSVLCPGAADTRIWEAERNRPPELRNEPSAEPAGSEQEAARQRLRRILAAGMSPQEVAAHAFKGIRDETFYILAYPPSRTVVRARMEHILQGLNPPDL